MMRYGKPMLVLGGGGYKIVNVARCWTYETAVLTGMTSCGLYWHIHSRVAKQRGLRWRGVLTCLSNEYYANHNKHRITCCCSGHACMLHCITLQARRAACALTCPPNEYYELFKPGRLNSIQQAVQPYQCITLMWFWACLHITAPAG
jgi:hypothetical protein